MSFSWLRRHTRHSQAKHIEAKVEYKTKRLRVVITDDGSGSDREILRSNGKGHWELSGMRKRADRIGARLKVRSRATAGTEVELSVPGHIAFQDRPSRNPLKWFTGWMREMPDRELQKPKREESK